MCQVENVWVKLDRHHIFLNDDPCHGGLFQNRKITWYQLYQHIEAEKTCRHFADDILKCIFVNENVWILFRISLKFVPKIRIYNIPALDQIMAWRRPGDKPLSEPRMVRLPTHIYVTRPQWLGHKNHIRCVQITQSSFDKNIKKRVNHLLLFVIMS